MHLSLGPTASLILKFVAFMQRSLDHFQPTTCVLVHDSLFAADLIDNLLVLYKTPSNRMHHPTWLCTNIARNTRGYTSPMLMIKAPDERTIIVTLLTVPDIITFLFNTSNCFSKRTQLMFILLNEAVDRLYRNDFMLSNHLKRLHSNGVLVLLYRQPTGIVLWNGFGAYAESHFEREPMLQESDLFDERLTASAIYHNRLRHLSPFDAVSVRALMDPPGVMLVDDGTGQWRRLAGADISLMVHLVERLRCRHAFEVWSQVRPFERSNDYEEILWREHVLKVRDPQWHRAYSEAMVDPNRYEYSIAMPLVEGTNEVTTPYREMPYKMLVSGVTVNDGRRRGADAELHLKGLTIWLIATALFAGLRCWIQGIRSPQPSILPGDRFVHCLFDTFARTLGTSSSPSSPPSARTVRSEQQLLLVVAAFALLAGATLAGTLFEAMLKQPDVYRINSVADVWRFSDVRVHFPYELKVLSQLTWLSSRVNNSLDAFNEPQDMVQRLFTADDEAFVVRESMVALLGDERMRFANGTPRYRLLKENYVKMFKSLVTHPWYLEFAVNRIVRQAQEHGLVQHFQSVWNFAYALIRERQMHAQIDNKAVNAFRPYDLKDIAFVLITLVCGWCMAVIGFIAERVRWSSLNK